MAGTPYGRCHLTVTGAPPWGRESAVPFSTLFLSKLVINKVLLVVGNSPQTKKKNGTDGDGNEKPAEPVILLQDYLTDHNSFIFKVVDKLDENNTKNHQDKIFLIQAAVVKRTIEEDPGIVCRENGADDSDGIRQVYRPEKDNTETDQVEGDKDLQNLVGDILPVDRKISTNLSLIGLVI